VERRIESELRELRELILSMVGYVEQAIEFVALCISEKSDRYFSQVRDVEKKINLAHVEVDNKILELLARMSPVAADLRLIIAIAKINTDLERMGDQSMNITHNLEDFFKVRDFAVDVQIVDMSKKVQSMVRKSLDAFVKLDAGLANEVLASDDEIDAYKNRTFKILVPYMQANTGHIEASLDMILIARNFERMADHATNIAEGVIFACTGRDVRHGMDRKND
jgi:phosphate transport system protein